MKSVLKYFFIMCISIIVLIKLISIDKKVLMMVYPNGYFEFVEKYSNEFSIDKNIIFAIIKCESNFNDKVVSNKGAQGLMQIMPETAKDVSRKYANSKNIENYSNIESNIENPNIKNDENNINLTDVDTNIKIGTNYFAYLKNKYSNNIAIALAAYNAGPRKCR